MTVSHARMYLMLLAVLVPLAAAAGCDDSDPPASGTAPVPQAPRAGAAGNGGGGDVPTPKAAADQSQIREVVTAWTNAMAAGDPAGARALSVGDAAAFEALDGMAAFVASSAKLRALQFEKFGAAPPAFEKALTARLENTSVQVDGDGATVTPAKGPPFKLRKQPDGSWRVDIDYEFNREPELNAKLRGMTRITDEMAAEIAAGQHTTVDAARKAMAEKYAALNMKPPPAPAAGDGLE